MNSNIVIRWIVNYFWNYAINTLVITLAITIFMIVFTFFNQADCMISSTISEEDVKEWVNHTLVIIDVILGIISLVHIGTAITQGVRGKGRGN